MIPPRARLTILAILILACGGDSTAPEPIPAALQLVYQNDFSDSAGPEWNTQSLANSPSGERYLGDVANGTVRLALSALPSHSKLEIEVDLYVIDTWDGNDSDWGPEVVTVSIDGATLLTTTFANQIKHRQAYPDPYPTGDNPASSGAAAKNSLGYQPDPGGDITDAIYRLVFEVDHTAPTLTFEISAQGLEAFPNEYWGIDNVRVRVK